MGISTATVEPIIHQESQPHDTAQQIVLHGVSWATYEQLLADFQDRHTVHFAFNQGVLEIMVLSAKHEEPNRTLSLLVEIVAVELDIDIRNLGSTTFKRADLAKGFEPDSCFYIQHEADIGGKAEVDLAVDPPPDLVIEIDITSPSLDKFPIYAQIGVPEIWRYDGKTLSILILGDGSYTQREESIALPGVTNAILAQFLEDSQHLKRAQWLRNVQAWARNQA